MSDEPEKSLGEEVIEGLDECTFDDIVVRLGYVSDKQGTKVATIYDPATGTGRELRKEPKE